MGEDLLVCRRATIEEIYELRFAVLRSGQKPVKLYFEGDGDLPPKTWHFGAFAMASGGGGAVRSLGCLTLLANTFEGAPAIQLRGMAVAEAVRGTGVGSRLIQAAETEVRGDARVGSWRWWCNARAIAVRFYERQGWKKVSEEFVIEGYGPHFRMAKP